jgi:hypothetical protein
MPLLRHHDIRLQVTISDLSSSTNDSFDSQTRAERVCSLIANYPVPYHLNIDTKTLGETSKTIVLIHTLSPKSTMADPSLYTYPSPLEGYENLPPLPT